MKIDDLFDSDLFRQMQADKMVTVRNHDSLPLSIVNYSDVCQYANAWNDVTMNCRGLIFEQLTGEVLARPWKKFFNLGDAKTPWIGFDDRVEVTDKVDGSLGILYMYKGKPAISTRGSFHSNQAAWATEHLKGYYESLNWDSVKNFTFLFEIVYPSNRIIVDYGKFEGLVLLGAVEVEMGYVIGPAAAEALLNWPGLKVEVMPYKSINDVLAADDRVNTEGYVIRRGNAMVKWKRPEYVELHRLISNLSEKSVWSGLEGGKTPEELCEALPDEFHGFVRETSQRLLQQFSWMHSYLIKKFDHYLGQAWHENMSRRDFAFVVKNEKDKKYMFALLDDKDITPMIWQELKPKGQSDDFQSRV